MVRIAIDAMGGDLGAKAMVKGAVESLKEEGMKLIRRGLRLFPAVKISVFMNHRLWRFEEKRIRALFAECWL